MPGLYFSTMKTLFIFLFLFISPVTEKVITGKIIRISDGDTIVILNEKKQSTRLRFAEIDAPEKGQDFYNKATEFVKELTTNKDIKIVQSGTDKYKRPLIILYADGVNVNEALVRAGLAWHYKDFSKSARLDSLEQMARKEKINIWSLPNPVPPWKYRKIQREKAKQKKAKSPST